MKTPNALGGRRNTLLLAIALVSAVNLGALAQTLYVYPHNSPFVISNADYRDWAIMVISGGCLVINDGAVLGGDADGSGRIYVQDNSSLVVNGGTIGGAGTLSGRIEAKGTATLTIRGGQFGAGRQTGTPILAEYAVATVTGGTFGGYDFASGQFELYNNSKVVIEGGVFGGSGEQSGRVLATDQAQVQISGGTYGGSGGQAGTWRPNGNSVWAILACSFNWPAGVNAFPYQQFVSLGGTFQSGQAFSTTIYRDMAASVDLMVLSLCGQQNAIQLDVVSGNPMLTEDWYTRTLIQTIYSECGPPTSQSDFPFSGIANGDVVLRAYVAPCEPGSANSPTVAVNWSVEGTPLNGNANWTGTQGDIHVSMPGVVGPYTVDFAFSIDGGPSKTVQRQLLVTKSAPLITSPPARVSSYQRAVEWAAGTSADLSDFETLSVLLPSMFVYGGTNWFYGGERIFNGTAGPNCDNLPPTSASEAYFVQPPLCGQVAGRCYGFSAILQFAASVLGIGGLIDHPVTPAHYFITVKAPSIDPAFPGSAFLKDSVPLTYDRYLFSDHSLLQYGTNYFDATFGKIYTNDEEFIAFHEDGNTATDSSGTLYYTTVEGARVYSPDPPGFWTNNWYSLYPFVFGWGSFSYVEPPLSPTSGPIAFNGGGTPPQFTGQAAYQTLDTNGDGLADQLIVDIDVDVPDAGAYVVTGWLERNGTTVANGPAFRSENITSAQLSAVQGLNTFRLAFSGEQILRSGLDGPYDLKVQFVGVGPGNFATTVLETPSYDHNIFGESGAHLVAAADSGVGAGGQGSLQGIQILVDLNVRRQDIYQISASLSTPNGTLAGAATEQPLSVGEHQIALTIPGQVLQRRGIDGPYSAVVSLQNTSGQSLGSLEFTTAAYTAQSFVALAQPDGSFTDTPLDTNGNGLFDILRITQPMSFSEAGDYIVSAKITPQNGTKSVYADTRLSLGQAGNTTIVWDFSGPSIWAQQLDGTFQVEVVVREAATGAELDRLILPQLTAAYDHGLFDSSAQGVTIQLTGAATTSGIDTNGNGLFDELSISLGVTVPRTTVYQWSAHLEDSLGREIAFCTGQESIPEGVGNIQLLFDGKTICRHAINGPYYLRGLVVFAPGQAALLASQAAVTQAFDYRQFETAIRGDLNADGDVDLDDLKIILAARGSVADGPDDPRDLDGDGKITALDARILVTLFTTPVGTARINRASVIKK